METQLEVTAKRINLGAGEIGLSENTARNLSYVTGGLLIVSSIGYFINNIDEMSDFSIKIITSIFYFISGSLFLFKAHFELSSTSKYAPHFIISQERLKIKRSAFKKSELINWENVQKIELGYYKIGIKDKKGIKYYPYNTSKETSIEIKRAIADIAAHNGVEVENLLKR